MRFYIETERLILRDLLPGDEAGMYELDSDPGVHTYLGGRPVQSIEECRRVIGIIREQYDANGIGRWAVIEKSTGAFIGWAGLRLMKEPINGHTGYYDLGYRFIKRCWGKGYATEAAHASVEYAWSVLNVNELFAIADIGNAASRNVLQKAGMRQTATFDHDGVPHAWYELKRPLLEYARGSAADKDQLIAVAIASYSEFAGVLTPENWGTMRTNLHSNERWDALLNNSQIFVAKSGETIVGAAYLVSSGNPTAVFDADWCYIRMVGVNPQYRGHGIAKELTKMCIAHAGTAGEKTVALHTSEFMDAARHVYERLGFTRLREIDAIFGKRYWLYTLKLGHDN